MVILIVSDKDLKKAAIAVKCASADRPGFLATKVRKLGIRHTEAPLRTLLKRFKHTEIYADILFF